MRAIYSPLIRKDAPPSALRSPHQDLCPIFTASRAVAASAGQEAAAQRGRTLVPLVHLLARQAARQFLFAHAPANDNEAPESSEQASARTAGATRKGEI